MPRGPQSEDRLVKQLAALDAKRKVLKKKLQVMRIRASAKRRKAMFATIRKNEKEVIEVLKTKAPDFFKRLVTADNTRKPRKKPGRKPRAAQG